MTVSCQIWPLPYICCLCARIQWVLCPADTHEIVGLISTSVTDVGIAFYSCRDDSGDPIVPEIKNTTACYLGKGNNYRGRVSTTISGRTCMLWLSQTPHAHSNTPENYPCRWTYDDVPIRAYQMFYPKQLGNSKCLCLLRFKLELVILMGAISVNVSRWRKILYVLYTIVIFAWNAHSLCWHTHALQAVVSSVLRFQMTVSGLGCMCWFIFVTSTNSPVASRMPFS